MQEKMGSSGKFIFILLGNTEPSRSLGMGTKPLERHNTRITKFNYLLQAIILQR